MSFWGVEVKWGETVEVDPSDWPAEQLHISQATLWQNNPKLGRIGVRVTVIRDDEAEEDTRSEEEIERDEEDSEEEVDEDDDDDEAKEVDDEDEEEEDGEEGSDDGYAFVSKQEVLICSLKRDTQESLSLDLIFSEPFSLELVCPGGGPEGLGSDAASVHLSGYYMPTEIMGPEGAHDHFDDEDEDEEDEEVEEEDEEAEELDEDDLRQVLARQRLKKGMAKLNKRREGAGLADEFSFEDDDEEDDDDEDVDDIMEDEDEEGGAEQVFSNTSLTSVRIVEVTEAEPQGPGANGTLASAQAVIEEPESPLAAEASQKETPFGGARIGESSAIHVAVTESAKKKQKKKKADGALANGEVTPQKQDPAAAVAAAAAEGAAGAGAGAAENTKAATPVAESKKSAKKQKQQPEELKPAETESAGGEKKAETPSKKKKGEAPAEPKQQQQEKGAKGAKEVAPGKAAPAAGAAAAAAGGASKAGAAKAEAAKPGAAKVAAAKAGAAKAVAGADKKAVKSATAAAAGGAAAPAATAAAGAKRPAAAVAEPKAGAGAGAGAAGGEAGQKEKKSKVKRTFPNGLEIEELGLGKPDGKVAKPGKTVFVKYIGKLKKNGKVFDSNLTGRSPFKFRLGIGEVIKGWDLSLEGMRVGDKRRLTIPPSLGYGSQGATPQIPPNAWLLFDVELVDVK